MRRHARSLTHSWIWSAIDTLASRSGLTPSGLARLAGLDPTTFNRSKRLTSEGRPRWPSTESIAKVLEATGTTLDAFATIELERPVEISFDETQEGEIAGVRIVAEVRDGIVRGWDPMPARAAAVRGGAVLAPARRRFAVAVGDASLEPAYSVGNVLVVSEAIEPRAGDRVLAKPSGMPVSPRLLLATSATHVELGSFADSAQRLSIRWSDLDWMARIILARQ
jgi:phage repressor protein C with HTH and peptisase S24 domain